MQKPILLILLILTLITVPATATLDVSLGDQGDNAIFNLNGSLIPIANLTVTIFNVSTGGTPFYNETFINAIMNGSWNVMLGNNTSIPLPLDQNVVYFKDYAINGEDLDFTDSFGNIVERQFFFAPIGQIQGSSINQTGLTFWQRAAGILSPNSTGDFIRIANGAPSTPSYSFINATGFGFYFNSVLNGIGLVAGGAERIVFGSTFVNSVIPFYLPSGASTVPVFSFLADNDTGMSRAAVNTIAFVAGGINAATLSESALITRGNIFINSTQVCTSENGLCNQTSANFTGFWVEIVGGFLQPNNSQTLDINQAGIENVSYICFDADCNVSIDGFGNQFEGFADLFSFEPVNEDRTNFFFLANFNGDQVMNINTVDNITTFNMNEFEIKAIGGTTDFFNVTSSIAEFDVLLDMNGRAIDQVRQITGRPLSGAVNFLLRGGFDPSAAVGATGDVMIATQNQGIQANENHIRFNSGNSQFPGEIPFTEVFFPWDFNDNSLSNVILNNVTVDNITVSNFTINENLDMNNFNITNVSTILFGIGNLLSIEEFSGDFRFNGGDLTLSNNDITGVDLMSNTRNEAGFGSPSLNSFAFTSDPDTGIFHAMTNILGFSAGGTNIVNISSNNITSSVGMFINGSEQVCTAENELCTGEATGATAFGLITAGDAGFGGIDDASTSVIDSQAFVITFVAGSEREVFFTGELPNRYIPGTDINLTINWSPDDATAGNVLWGIEYIFIDPNTGDALDDPSAFATVLDAAPGTALEVVTTGIITLNGTGVDVGDIPHVRLFRNGTIGSGDTYGDDAHMSTGTFTFAIQ